MHSPQSHIFEPKRAVLKCVPKLTIDLVVFKMSYTIETEKEEDGRFIAEVIELPEVLVRLAVGWVEKRNQRNCELTVAK